MTRNDRTILSEGRPDLRLIHKLSEENTSNALILLEIK
ncbi:MAG: hypothetical protein RL122_2146 [Pseudomonadota bacterium]|jgi:hypothetical protein